MPRAEPQHRQLIARNRPDGYWIAERDQLAADQAEASTFPRHVVQWALLMTDGAAMHVDETHRPRLVRADHAELLELLVAWRQWEATTDPDGQQLPRAKRHDDMTIATVRLQ